MPAGSGLRTPDWRRRALWSRIAGLALLLLGFFAPLPPPWVLAVTVPGLALFLFGAIAWLLRTPEPWLRRRL